MNSFIPRKAMLHTHSFGVSQNGDDSSPSKSSESSDSIVLIDDEVIRVSAIFVRPSCSGRSTDCLEAPKMDSLDRVNYTDGSPHSETGLTLKPGDTAVVYACELPEIKGKFDPVKAAALGLKPGPKYRELQLGNSVMSDRLNIMVSHWKVIFNGLICRNLVPALVDSLCTTATYIKWGTFS